MDSQTALKQLEELRQKHANYGACDTEGRYAVMDIEDAVIEGKPFPFRPKTDRLSQMRPFNPFSLYSTVPGWETASDELIEAAYAYWKALTEEKLGIVIADREFCACKVCGTETTDRRGYCDYHQPKAVA